MNGFFRRRVRQALEACGRSLIQAVMAPVGILLFTASVVGIVYLPIGIGILLAPAALLGVRGFANQHRRWALEWSGVRVGNPYRRPPVEIATGRFSALKRCKWVLTDPATWRDLLWSIVNAPVGILLGVLPAALILNGVEGIVISPWIWIFSPGHQLYWLLSVPLGVACMAIGLTSSPAILRGHALYIQSMLGPTRTEIEARVEVLTDSRSDVVDTSAAELRRIERDLHDGAQARLVSLGMSIGLAERTLRENPDAALALLAEARESSGQALSELRDLVRGIHPPVLAERGLDGAVRALVLTLPIPVELHIDLPGRPSAPVESAAYFAVAEALANVVKHSSASRAWVQVHYDPGKLVLIVGDNGVGGAVAGPEGGLRGVERRLAAFDGTAAVTSPSGGPTMVSMELPCELSSART